MKRQAPLRGADLANALSDFGLLKSGKNVEEKQKRLEDARVKDLQSTLKKGLLPAVFKGKDVFAVKVPNGNYAICYERDPGAKLYFSKNQVEFKELPKKKTPSKRALRNQKDKQETEKKKVKMDVAVAFEANIEMDGDNSGLEQAFPGSKRAEPPGPEGWWKRHQEEVQKQRALYFEQKEKFSEHFGEWIAFVNGSSVGFFPSMNEAISAGSSRSRELNLKAFFVTRVGYEYEVELRPSDVLVHEEVTVVNQDRRPFIAGVFVREPISNISQKVPRVIVDTGARPAFVCHPSRASFLAEVAKSNLPVPVDVKLTHNGDVHQVDVTLMDDKGDIALIGMPIIQEYDFELPQVALGRQGSLKR